MNDGIYDNLPPKLRQELISLSTQAETVGIDAQQFAALLIDL